LRSGIFNDVCYVVKGAACMQHLFINNQDVSFVSQGC